MNINLMRGVGFIKSEIAAKHEEWNVIRDCILGEHHIKSKTIKYLPIPNSATCDNTNSSLYKSYIDRAQFINAVRRTVHELIGQVFVKEPFMQIEDDALMNLLRDNADGKGVNLVQCAKKTLKHNIAYGYAGVYVDVPSLTGGISKSDYNSGAFRPTIQPISPFRIRNFRVEKVGNVEKLTLVVLNNDVWRMGSDGFEDERKAQLIVLRLTNGVFYKDIYENKGAYSAGIFNYDWEKRETIQPTDSAGQPLTEIPFFFVGVENNNPYPDEPIMYDLASVNISHYRNSADYEQTMFVAGQPTLVLSGLNVPKEVGSETEIKLGVNRALLLKNGGTASLVQARAETGLMEAMSKKEAYMVSFGAKFLDEDVIVKTAYQVKAENGSQKSILTNCTDNVSTAYTAALKYIHKICGYSDEKVEMTLNTDFEYNKVGAEELNNASTLYEKGLITFNEFRAVARRAKLATEDDKLALKEIEERLQSQTNKANKEQTNDGKTQTN